MSVHVPSILINISVNIQSSDKVEILSSKSFLDEIYSEENRVRPVTSFYVMKEAFSIKLIQNFHNSMFITNKTFLCKKTSTIYRMLKDSINYEQSMITQFT